MTKSKAGTALLAGLLFAATSQAGSISYYLDQSNQLADGINYLQVTISDERKDGVIDFTVEALQPLLDLAGKNFGIQAFGFNVVGGVGAEARNVKKLPDDWRARNGGRMDGFGLFDITMGTTSSRGHGHDGDDDGKGKGKGKSKGNGHYSHGNGNGYGHGGKANPQQPLTFSIKGVSLDDIFSYVDLSTGKAPEGWSLFAARVTGLSIGDCDFGKEKKGASSNKCGGSAYFGGGPAVPAPPAIWLLGTAVAGLVVRRLRKGSAVATA